MNKDINLDFASLYPTTQSVISDFPGIDELLRQRKIKKLREERIKKLKKINNNDGKES